MARSSLSNATRNIAPRLAKSQNKRNTFRRALSTVNATTSSNTSGSRQEPLTLLHKTSKLLPQVLQCAPLSVGDKRTLAPEAWEKILSNIYEDLSSASQRTIRLTVYGVDSWSGSEDFVTALLSNPLDSSNTQSQALRDRWKHSSSESLTISYGPKVTTEKTHIKLASPYLQRFSAPVEVVELRAARSTHQKRPSVIEDSVLAKLFEADIPILLCNPIATSVESLLATPLPSNTIVILTTAPSQTIDLCQLLSSVPQNSPKPTLLIVDPQRASDAIDLLQSNPTSPYVVQRFQDVFNGSNIAAVRRALESILDGQLAAPPTERLSTSSFTSNTLQAKFALIRLHDTLSHCLDALGEMQMLLNAASIDASRLSDKLEEIRVKVELEFLGPVQSLTPTSTRALKPRFNEVTETILSAETQMKSVMSRFSWWWMIWRVDEITALVTAALQQTWCPELERKLLIHTGQLHSIQSELTEDSLGLLSKHPTLQTNVLRNTLMQLKASPQHHLTANTLTSPISSRRTQIIEYPTARLHLTAQRAVLGMSGGLVGGAGIGWVGWMGWLVGSGEGLLGSLGLEPATAMGLGALSAAASMRWAIGRWEKGKKKWWDDWRRVGDSLDRDLRVTLDHCMKQQVGGVAQATSKGLAQLIAVRENDIGRLRDEVRVLKSDVKEAVRDLVHKTI